MVKKNNNKQNKNIRDMEALKAIWLEEEQHAFAGWDFSHLKGRWSTEPNGWDYKQLVAAHLKSTDYLLDIGTGGGEFLLSLNHPHELTCVTEGWAPNIALCNNKLAPLGIKIYPVSGEEALPIADNQFNIIINRHESYNLNEVRRVLKPGGLFITQQVGGDNSIDFAKRINPKGKPLYENFSLCTEMPKFKDSGFDILYTNQSHPELRFFDIGAIVFWAKIIEWTFPGFSVNNNFTQLCELQEELEQKGYISAEEHFFIIISKNIK